MILVEEFKGCISDDLKTYLDEKRVDSVYEMTILVDEYVLRNKRGKPDYSNPFEFASGPRPRHGWVDRLVYPTTQFKKYQLSKYLSSVTCISADENPDLPLLQ